MTAPIEATLRHCPSAFRNASVKLCQLPWRSEEAPLEVVCDTSQIVREAAIQRISPLPIFGAAAEARLGSLHPNALLGFHEGAAADRTPMLREP